MDFDYYKTIFICLLYLAFGPQPAAHYAYIYMGLAEMSVQKSVINILLAIVLWNPLSTIYRHRFHLKMLNNMQKQANHTHDVVELVLCGVDNYGNFGIIIHILPYCLSRRQLMRSKPPTNVITYFEGFNFIKNNRIHLKQKE